MNKYIDKKVNPLSLEKERSKKMARYKDEQCRRCRREGQKLFLKGERCYTDKCSISRRMELEKNNLENILKWLQTKKE